MLADGEFYLATDVGQLYVGLGGANLNTMQLPPCVFNTGQFKEAGNTPIWTPTTGKKFRLLRYMIESTLNTSQASQGVLTISFQDGTSPMPLAHDVYVQSTALKYNTVYQTGWVNLDSGFLSSAANNMLNVNLSASLTAGSFRITTCGVEE